MATVLIIMCLVYLILGVTRTDLSRNVTSAPAGAEAIPGHVAVGGMGDMAIQRDIQETMDNIGQELAQAPAGDIPPYPMWDHGKYNGWLWTLAQTKFHRTDTLVNWPPSLPGSCKWWATLQGSTLILARDRPLPESMQKGAQRQSSGHAPAHELDDALIVREVDLEGCSVTIVTEGLRGKSRWLRKAPLEIKHPDRDIFEGQREVLLFAAGSAAKEQWFIALSCACKTDAGAGLAISSLYSSFCEYTRASALVEYSQVHDDSAAAHAETEGGKAEQKHPRRWLSRWLHKREHGKQKLPVAVKVLPAKKQPKKEESESLKASESKPPVLNPTECMDQLWMGKGGGMPTPDKLERQNGQSRVLDAPGAEREGRSASAPLPATAAPDTELQDMSKVQKPPQGPAATLLAARPPQVSVSPSMPAMHAQEADEEKGDGAQPPQVEDEGDLSDDKSSPGSPTTPAHVPMQNMRGHAGDRSAARRGAANQRRQAAAALPSVPVEAGLNLFMARIGFDLLRSAVVKDHLQAHIQRKLNVLRIPEYISSLEVVDVDMGCTVPGISNLRALPSPSSNLWPQFLFDIDYNGGLVVIVEAKLELRDSASWDTLDRAIKRVGGVAAAAVEGNGKGVPTAATASKALSPRDSDDDDSTADEPAQRRRQGRLQRLRDMAAKGIRNLAEITADHISRMHLRVRVEIHSLEGTICAWVPPPPNDRLWFGFVTPPELKADATPILNDDVRGRMLMYSYQITNVPHWVAAKLQSAITKNMTLPSCADIPLPFLVPVDHANAAQALPAFLRALYQAGEGSEAAPGDAENNRVQRPRTRGAAKMPFPLPAPVTEDERKPPRTIIHWPRRGSRKAKQAAPDRDCEHPATAPTSSATPRAALKSRRASREERLPSYMELSTCLTSEERAEQGEELRTLAITHGRTQAGYDGSSSDPLGATANTLLVVQDARGSLAVTATMGPTGEVAPTTLDTTAEAEESDSSTFPFSKLSAREAAVPLQQFYATDNSRPTAASESTSAGSTVGETAPGAGSEQADNDAARPEPSQLEHASSGGLATQSQAAPPGWVADGAAGSAHVVQHPTVPCSNESRDSQELVPSHVDDLAADMHVLGSSPALGSPLQGQSRTGRSPSLGWSPQADREGDLSGERPKSGQWRELGGTMGKKYYEAFKNRNSLTYTQGKKIANVLAGQAQEHVRKALANRDKAAKDEKRS
ncbi:g1914 [Coccomyxa elongata]